MQTEQNPVRTAIAERIISIHQHQIPMEAGWRESNDWNLQNFAYSIADIILKGKKETFINAFRMGQSDISSYSDLALERKFEEIINPISNNNF